MNYEPKFKINQEVYFANARYYIRGMQAKMSSYPNPEIEYFLSVNFNRPSTTNETNVTVNETNLLSVEEFENEKIKEAQDFLKSKGLFNQ